MRTTADKHPDDTHERAEYPPDQQVGLTKTLVTVVVDVAK